MKTLKFWITLYAIGTITDLVTTYVGITQYGATEMNPMAAWVIAQGWHWLMIVKIATIILLALLCNMAIKLGEMTYIRNTTLGPSLLVAFWAIAVVTVSVHNTILIMFRAGGLT